MAYSKFEQAYVDTYMDAMYPMEPAQPEQSDTMLAAAPSAEPKGQVSVSGFTEPQVMTDAPQGFGVARPIPQNKAQEALGYLGELLTKAGVQLDKVGIDIPVLGRVSLKDLTVGESGKVLEDAALGFYPVEGAGGFISGTTRIKPDPAMELLNIAPAAAALAKVGGKAAVKGVTKAVEATKNMPVGMSTKAVGQGVDELGFYSAAKQAVDAIQQPKGTGQQFLKQIEKTPGVKPDEIKWTGLDDFLKSKKTVTKQEVQDYMAANRVEIKEVKLGEQEAFDESRLRQLEEEFKTLKQHPIDDPSFGEDKYDELIKLMNIRDRSTTDSLYASAESATRAAQRAQARGMPEAAEKLFREAELYNTRAEKLDLNDLGMDAPTKFSKYTLPGGENYREILLTLPSKMLDRDSPEMIKAATEAYGEKSLPRLSDSQWQLISNRLQSTPEFKSQHFDQPNILAHLRVNDRVIDGKKTLFVEEVQSDWHQAGRKKGYQKSLLTDAEKKRWNELTAKDNRNAITDADRPEFQALAEKVTAEILAKKDGVPDAPFKTTWSDLSMKRVIQMASEGGYDRIAFTTGKTQAERYDLSKQVNMISAMPDKNGKYNIYIEGKDGDPVFRNTNGFSDYGQKTVTPEEFEELVGKDAAKTIMQKADELNRGKVSKDQFKFYDSKPADLTIGGEGMKGFYDDILPKFLDKYAKKWDAKTGVTEMPVGKGKPTQYADFDEYSKAPSQSSVSVNYIDVTPKMRESVVTKGQPMFAIGAGGAGAAATQEENK